MQSLHTWLPCCSAITQPVRNCHCALCCALCSSKMKPDSWQHVVIYWGYCRSYSPLTSPSVFCSWPSTSCSEAFLWGVHLACNEYLINPGLAAYVRETKFNKWCKLPNSCIPLIIRKNPMDQTKWNTMGMVAKAKFDDIFRSLRNQGNQKPRSRSQQLPECWNSSKYMPSF